MDNLLKLKYTARSGWRAASAASGADMVTAERQNGKTAKTAGGQGGKRVGRAHKTAGGGKVLWS